MSDINVYDYNLNEIENIREFLKEALLRADPSIDVSPGSTWDTEVITPVVERIGPDAFDTPIRDFIKARIRSEYPDLVLQDGDALDDAVIKINQVIMEPLRRQIKLIALGQSVANTDTLNEEEADNLGANYFVRRHLGGFAVGVARLYCTSPQSLLVTPSNPCNTSGGLRFFPVENQAISADVMQLQVEGGLYYFDIVVRAEQQGDQYNIDPGELISIDNVGNVTKVTNKSSFDEGADKESTEEFLERVEASLTEKSLVTIRGINARLLDVFDNIRAISVIGYGDPEMERDILQGGSIADVVVVAFSGTATAGSGLVTLGDFYGYSAADFSDAGVEIGMTLVAYEFGGAAPQTFTVTGIIGGVEPKLEFEPVNVAGISSCFWVVTTEGSSGGIVLSKIPGGIIVPDTDYGTVEVNDDEVHIGGVLDVYIRAGFPQERSTTLQSIRDAEPLHFGVDLETFGEEGNIFVALTDGLPLGAYTDTNNELLVYLKKSATRLWWYPTDADVGRYIQLLGAINRGTYKIEEVLGREKAPGGQQVVRVVLGQNDFEKGPSGYNTVLTAAETLDIKIIDEISVKYFARDRDDSNEPAGANLGTGGVGAEIGDSLVLETGDDKDIYTIREVLDSIGTGDVLLLSQELTKTVTPINPGGGSGLRYRIADELDVNLIEPRTTKIPMGADGGVYAGDDLSTVAGSNTVTSSGSTNFALAGVEVGDILEILEGDAAGEYLVQTVGGSSVEVSPAPSVTVFNVAFTVYTAFDAVERPLVRVREVELLDSAAQPTGVKIPYGNYIDARALGVFSNRAAGLEVESYSGALTAATNRLADTQVDFALEGIEAGYRVSVLEEGNAGDYVVKSRVDANTLEFYTAAEGGKDISSNATSVHYRIGQPSTGYVRVYFLEPTSVNILTGLQGGRLQYTSGEVTQSFLFSEVEGRYIIPAPASDDEKPRDLRVASYLFDVTDYNTWLEFTDENNPDVYEMELKVGDVIEIQQQIQLRDSSDNILSFYGGDIITAGVVEMYAGIPGLITVAGSDKVRIPSNSAVDFIQMDTTPNFLTGQTLYIEDGPDAGEYIIEAVTGPKELRLNAAMISSTETFESESDGAAATLDVITSHPDAILTDTVVNPAEEIGQYITIYEVEVSGHDEVAESQWRVKAIDLPGNNVTLENVGSGVSAYALGAGEFKWIRTRSDTGILRQFSIYETVPKAVAVKELAPTALSKTPRSGHPTGIATATISNPGSGIFRLERQDDPAEDFIALDDVVPGDIVEICEGTNDSFRTGVYFVDAVASRYLDVIPENPFQAVVTAPAEVAFRVRGGIHGNRRMVLVEGFENNGLIRHGFNLPYSIRRPGLLRLSSTEMVDNYDGALYYMDVQVESLGAGDELNLPEGSRFTVESGLSADGYTYLVDNTVLTFSPYEEVNLKFDRRFLPSGNSDLPENLTEISSRNLRISYDMSPTVRIVDDLLHSEADRPINANPIGRHFLPSYVYATIVYQGGSSDTVVGPEVEDYINGLGPEDELQVSDLEALVTRRGAHYIRHPLELVAVTHDLDRNLVVERSEDLLGGSTVPYNGSARTSSFFAKIDEGLNVDRES